MLVRVSPTAAVAIVVSLLSSQHSLAVAHKVRAGTLLRHQVGAGPLVGNCQTAYPGTKPLAPPGATGSECSCVADPTDKSSEEAWLCDESDGFELEWEDVTAADGPQAGISAYQWHCVKENTEVQMKPMKQQLLCPAGWGEPQNVDGKPACKWQTDLCPPDATVPAGLELAGHLSGLTTCPCEMTQFLKCDEGSTVDMNDFSCNWEVPEDVTQLVIQKPTIKYADGPAVGDSGEGMRAMEQAPVPPEAEATPSSDEQPPAGARTLPAADFAIAYDAPMMCPAVINIPHHFVTCGPRSPAAVFDALRRFLQIEESKDVVQPSDSAAETWWECSTKCVNMYAKATECALSSKYPCKVTAATPGINYQNAKKKNGGLSQKKLGEQHRTALMNLFEATTKDSCHGSVSGGFTYIKKQDAAQKDRIKQVLFTSADMGMSTIFGRIDELQALVQSGVTKDHTRMMSLCSGTDSRNDDGTCKSSAKVPIDWDKSFSNLRESMQTRFVGTAASVPFAVDCRAIAAEIFGKNAQTVGGCLDVCDKNSGSSDSNQQKKMAKWRKMTLPQEHCACGKVSVGGKCKKVASPTKKPKGRLKKNGKGKGKGKGKSGGKANKKK